MVDPSKRSFFKSFLIEFLSMAEEFNGIPQYRVDELEKVPDHILKDMVPVVNVNKPSRIEDNWILLKDVTNGTFKRYYKLKNYEGYMFRCFDGNHSISGICNLLEVEFSLDSEEAYAQTKSLFIRLAQAGLCHPVGVHK